VIECVYSAGASIVVEILAVDCHFQLHVAFAGLFQLQDAHAREACGAGERRAERRRRELNTWE
jgi:hypothetical protein